MLKCVPPPGFIKITPGVSEKFDLREMHEICMCQASLTLSLTFNHGPSTGQIIFIISLEVVCRLNIFLLNIKSSKPWQKWSSWRLNAFIISSTSDIYTVHSYRTGQSSIFVPEEVNTVTFVGLCLIAGGFVCLFFYDTAPDLLARHRHGNDVVCVCCAACLAGALSLIFPSQLFRCISCTVLWNNTIRDVGCVL